MSQAPAGTVARLAGIARAGRAVDRVLSHVKALALPGVGIDRLERAASEEISRLGAIPSMLGYQDAHGGGAFPAPISVSINDQIMGGHAAVSVSPLQAGDLVTLDLALELGGWHADAAVTWCLDDADPKRAYLARAAEAVTRAGVLRARPGIHWGLVAQAMLDEAARQGVELLRGYDGHGIGRSMHEPPRLPSHPADLDRLEGDGIIQTGMVLAIEPVVGTPGSVGKSVMREGWIDRLEAPAGALGAGSGGGRAEACFAEATVAVGRARNLILAGDSWWGSEHDLWRGGG